MSKFRNALHRKAVELRLDESEMPPSTIKHFGGYPIPVVGCTPAEIKQVMKV